MQTQKLCLSIFAILRFCIFLSSSFAFMHVCIFALIDFCMSRMAAQAGRKHARARKEYSLDGITDDELLSTTGCDRELLDGLFAKYTNATHLPSMYAPLHFRTVIEFDIGSLCHSDHLYNLLLYYKMYPQRRQLPVLRFRMVTRDSRSILKQIRETEKYLAGAMTDVKEAWEGRWSSTNVLPHYFGPEVRASVDSFPIYICRSKDASMQSATFNGKYGNAFFYDRHLCTFV
jgi:hypothetical protein